MASHRIASAPLRVVLSGGIGAGKSTVAELLRRHGFVVVSADELGHAVLAPDGEAFAAVARRWPETVRAGSVDRARLAELVFGDPAALAELEAITHPAIARRIRAAAEAAGDRPFAVEVPVISSSLVDPGWTKVLVEAPAELRRARAVARGGDPADVARRMAAQPDPDRWREWADEVVENVGDLHDLEAEVAALVARLGDGRSARGR